MLFLYIVLLLAGFLLVIKGADWLVDGASALAKRLHVSDLVIGLTVVAFGTSAPELAVNVFASLNKTSEIAIGNILGSNIANIFLILGMAAFIFPLKITKGTVWKEIPFSLLAVMIVGIMANDILIDKVSSSTLTRIDGLILLCFFIIFLYSTFANRKNSEESQDQPAAKKLSLPKSIFFILLGLTMLVVGGQLIVTEATAIATMLGVSTSLIALTVVAFGTSVPELATSVVAALKKNANIAVGNVVGSNIFNIFLILGVSSTIYPITFLQQNSLDIIVVLLASLVLFIFMFIGKRHILERWQGLAMVIIYVIYIIYLIVRG